MTDEMCSGFAGEAIDDAVSDGRLDADRQEVADAGAEATDGRPDGGRRDACGPSGGIDAAQVARCGPLAEQFFHEELAQGFSEEEATERAWVRAMAQDNAVTQAAERMVDERMAALEPYLGPQVIGSDVSAFLGAEPVKGLSSEELTTAILRDAGIQPSAWLAAKPEVRLDFLRNAARIVAYEKWAASQGGPTVPAQEAPGVLGRGQAMGLSNTAFETQVRQVMQTMGLSRTDAEAVVRG